MNRHLLSLEQEYALQVFESGSNVFITGPAGTGKTCLIHQIIASAKNRGKDIRVCAMTGCAAILLGCNATTLHSWSGIRLGRGSAVEIMDFVLNNRYSLCNWIKTDILVIDEVSMLSMRIFDVLNLIGQEARSKKSPFGGIQLVFTGDFHQLPPVDTSETPFCFESNDWYTAFPLSQHIELTTLFRQKDPVYKAILNNVRVGTLDSNDIQVLNQCLHREYKKEDNNGCVPTKLFATKHKVDLTNREMFDALEGVTYEFQCIQKSDCMSYLDTGKTISHESLLKCKRGMTPKAKEYELEYLMTNCPVDRILVLKKGANVMCTSNLDVNNGICNGSIGIIEEFEGSLPRVLFSNGVRRLMDVKYWQSEEYPVIAVGQIPLRLAWAMTIHKIQGATLSMAEIDVGSKIFEYGQTYVALSRVQSLEGLYLSGFNPSKIKAHPKVRAFYAKIPKVELEEYI